MQLPSKQVFKIFNSSLEKKTIPFSRNLETEKHENFSTTKQHLSVSEFLNNGTYLQFFCIDLALEKFCCSAKEEVKSLESLCHMVKF